MCRRKGVDTMNQREQNALDSWITREDTINEFEEMRDTAEIKALSKVSLERPLSDDEYKRMMELGEKLGLR